MNRIIEALQVLFSKEPGSWRQNNKSPDMFYAKNNYFGESNKKPIEW